MIKHIYNTKLDLIALMIISSDNTVKLGHISLPVLADESVFSPLDAL